MGNLLKKMGKSPIMLLFGLLVLVLFVVQSQASTSTNKIAPTTKYIPDAQYTAYINAPNLTQDQINHALKVVSTSNVYNKYIQYPHGNFSICWAYPYTGAIHISTVIN